MAVFDHENYKNFVLEELELRPKRGRGEFLRIAKALSIHTTMVTHIFRGDSELNLEQALALADYFGLGELETEYLVALVQLARAANERAKQFCRKRMRSIKEKSANVGNRLDIKNALDEKDQAVFYSSWTFAAIRLLTAIPGLDNSNAIAKSLNLNLSQVNSALEFLISRGLVKIEKNRLSYGDTKTYAERDSKFASRHSLNWHLKVIERLESIDPSEIAFSNAVVLSESDFEKITEMIVKFIAEFQKTTTPSPSEILCCLNIDWLKLTKSKQ